MKVTGKIKTAQKLLLGQPLTYCIYSENLAWIDAHFEKIRQENAILPENPGHEPIIEFKKTGLPYANNKIKKLTLFENRFYLWIGDYLCSKENKKDYFSLFHRSESKFNIEGECNADKLI